MRHISFWTSEEIQTLTLLYPIVLRDKVTQALPNHSGKSIYNKARELGLIKKRWDIQIEGKPKKCTFCGAIFQPKRTFQKYCSKECRYKNYLERRFKGYYSENCERIKAYARNHHKNRDLGVAYCQQCDNKFQSWIFSQKFCSKQCQEIYWRERGMLTRFKGDKRNSDISRKGRMKQVFPKKHTSIEVALQQALEKRNINFQTNYSILGICQADIAIPEHMVAVFCDGDYWHRLPGYAARDTKINKALSKAGWHVLRFWEFEIKSNVDTCAECVKGVMPCV